MHVKRTNKKWKYTKKIKRNATKKPFYISSEKIDDICKLGKYNTFEGSIFKRTNNAAGMQKVFNEYLSYKEHLKSIVKDVNLIKEHRKDDFFTYINEDWISSKEKELQKELKYYAQVDSFRIVQEKVYYEVMGYVNNYIKANPTQRKAKMIENVYKALYKTNKSIGIRHTTKVKETVENFIASDDMYGMLAYANHNEIYSWASPLSWSVLPDEKDVTKYVSHLSIGTLGIYDINIYFDEPTDDHKTKLFKKEFKSKYLQFIRDTFKLVLPKNHKEFNPEDIWNVELQLIDALICDKVTKHENPEYYNVVTKKELETKYKLDWTTFSKKLGYDKPPEKIITSSLNTLMCIVELIKKNWKTPEWKTYWCFMFYKTMIRFEWDWNQTYYDFYAKFVQGQPVRFPRELYPIFMLSFTFNTFLTEQYISHNYNPLYVNYVTNMVEDLRKIFINKIKRNTWLQPSTKNTAIKKLEKLKLYVGNPENLREDPLLDYCSNDPWHNMGLLAEWRHNKFIELDGKSTGVDVPDIDWNELKLTGTQAYVVNAYYRPTSNSIYIPLAFLQKPFIDLDERGIEYNLAHLGYTVSHELSHCLDDLGSKFDEMGNLKNWWTDRDRKKFQLKIKDVNKQYIEAAKKDGIEYDATIAVGENLADISGMSLAEEYLLLFQEANDDVDVIKKISLDAFYVYIAIQSRQKIHDKAIPAQLKTNPHPLEKYRCNCPLSRLDIFRTIYNIKKGDGMWWHNNDTIW